jgi:hypothetical protein
MEEQQIKKKEKDTSVRERQTFFRVTFKNNCNLLQIADNKANMIISINALVISSIIAIAGYGTISDELDLAGSKMILPIALILISCLSSTILAVQAAKPKIIDKNQDVMNKGKASLLFFGEVANYTLPEYLTEVEKILPNQNEINEQMSIAVYYQGKVLKRKYNMLGYAYNIFLMGIVFGVVVFLIYMFS